MGIFEDYSVRYVMIKFALLSLAHADYPLDRCNGKDCKVVPCVPRLHLGVGWPLHFLPASPVELR